MTTFRYLLRPHEGGYSPLEAARFGLETTRPLIVAAADTDKPVLRSLLTLTSPDVLIETLKVSHDGRALILRLFGASGQAQSVGLRWGNLEPGSVWVSDLTEKAVRKAEGRVEVPAYEIVTLRAEFQQTTDQ